MAPMGARPGIRLAVVVLAVLLVAVAATIMEGLKSSSLEAVRVIEEGSRREVLLLAGYMRAIGAGHTTIDDRLGLALLRDRLEMAIITSWSLESSSRALYTLTGDPVYQNWTQLYGMLSDALVRIRNMQDQDMLDTISAKSGALEEIAGILEGLQGRESPYKAQPGELGRLWELVLSLGAP